MNIVGVIPARYASSRFEGKPLADICGKPMLWWVYNQATKVKSLNQVFVATDDERIECMCLEYKMNVIMTSKSHQTGTDRVGEVARKIKADLYLNIQGDEPLIEPATISKAIEPFLTDAALQVTNLMTKIKNPVDAINTTVPKVVTNSDNIGIYLSRSAIPFPKAILDYCYFKQVCVYGYKPEALELFSNANRGKLEEIEDIELLRFIEHGIAVKFVEVDSDTIAVDTPKDLERVKNILVDSKCSPYLEKNNE